jgi:hypothetical protein
MIGTAAQRTERRNVIGSAMEGLDAKRTFARLQLEGEEFLLTSLFIELVGRDGSSESGWLAGMDSNHDSRD